MMQLPSAESNIIHSKVYDEKYLDIISLQLIMHCCSFLIRVLINLIFMQNEFMIFLPSLYFNISELILPVF